MGSLPETYNGPNAFRGTKMGNVFLLTMSLFCT